MINADVGLNGKIVLDITSNEDTVSFLYLQPNNFNDEHSGGTVGILENNMVYADTRSGVYQVPADWTMSLNYNIGYFKGAVQLRIKLMFYDEEDIKEIENMWQPTATYYVNFED